MAKVTAALTEDKQNVRVEFHGDVSYQEAVALSNAILLQSIAGFRQFSEANLPEEEQEEVLLAMYDDLNLRFSNILDNLIPPEDLGLDFTEEAEQALEKEDRYIDLRFKEVQYDKIISKLESTDTKHTKVTLNKDGSFKL